MQPTRNTQPTVLILGASGKIGSHFARAFAEAGWQVRNYDRKSGDMTAAAMGADVIVNGLNPPAYHDWARIIPAITQQVLAAARASGATVIVPGNVYVYGDQPGPWGADTPHRPVSRKGRIRAEMEATYRAAAREGVRSIILHAGDFIDPERNGDVMSTFLLRSLKAGKITAGGPADAVRAYAYLPDLARVAVGLAERRAELPAFADIPFAGHAFSVDGLKAEIERQTGRPLKLARFPWWMMRMLAPVWELARELVEMRYLYATPHRLSSGALEALLPGFEATPFAEVVAASLPDVEPDQPVQRRVLA
jgi:nucleoside-diphosphate-sugar epimerase